MKLFGGKHRGAQPEAPAGRRRPLPQDEPVRPAGAFSYYAQRSGSSSNTGRHESQPTTDGQPTSRLAGRRRLYGGLLIVAAIGSLYCLILTPQAHVVLLQDRTTAYFLQEPAVYQQTAQAALSSSIFNRNKLTVDTGAVRHTLLSLYPEIKNVSVALPLVGHQPQVFIEPYKPSFILTTSTGNAFLLDATGRALAATSQIPDIDRLGVPTLHDQSGLDVKIGSRAVPSTTVSFVQTVVAALHHDGLTPSKLTLPAGTQELDAAIGGVGYAVKFNLMEDPLQQSGTYLATRQRLQGDGVVPSAYVDVRIPGRAYYK